MPGQLALLFSDYLIWGTTLAATILLLLGLRNPLQRQRWQMILSSAPAMASSILLMVFLSVALLDSIHFRPLVEANPLEPEQPTTRSSVLRYAGSEISLLDQILTPLRSAQERTYSAPLAIFSYSKESIISADGIRRVYPRLEYGGAHLDDPDQHHADLIRRSLQGVGIGLFLLIPLGLLLSRVTAGSNIGDSPLLAWRSAFVTLAGLILLGSIAGQLAGHYHLLGTDKVGQDVLYLGLKSIRTGVLIGTLTLLIMLPFAVLLGMAAGYFGGRIDDVIQYIYTTLSSIPGVLLIAAAVLSINLYLDQNLTANTSLHQRADLRLLMLTGILGLTGWIGLCRLLRAESLKLRELDYVTAARAFGVSDPRILLRHLLPNLGHLVLITLVIDFSGLVLAEAVLSYVGVGVDPSMISWGNMINGARLELAREPVVWWSLATAFIFMFTLVLCANLFADAVRDALDPRLRGSQ